MGIYNSRQRRAMRDIAAAKRIEQGQQAKADRAFNADRILRNYEEAYEAANGNSIALEYRGGWVYRTGGADWAGPYRLTEVERMAAILWSRTQTKHEGD